MKRQYSISMYLDTRKEKKNGKYPVKLRVYANQLDKQKLYPTKFDFTKDEFKRIWETSKPRVENKETRKKIQAVETKAENSADAIDPFSFEKFERKLYLKTGEGDNVFYHYESIIKQNRKQGRIGNAQSYELSQKSLKSFIEATKGYVPDKIRFAEITPEWLRNYDDFMLNPPKDSERNSRSQTTLGMYLRALRSVFNTAIRENDIPDEGYPFGKGKYQIPAPRMVKKALNNEQLKILYNTKPKTSEQEKAKDFWFFSYVCSGINIKDIALLRWKDVKDEKIIYYRAKTKNTKRADLKPITIHLNDFSKFIINKYGSPEQDRKRLLFSIIDDEMNQETKHNKIKNFTRFLNQNIKKLAITVNLPGDISTYWARHSFATKAIRDGKSMEFVSEALNHGDVKTTQNYIAGFDDKVKKEFSDNLMNF